MLGLLKYPDDFSKAQGLNQLWYKDTATTAVKADNNGFAARHAYLIQSPTVKGTFSFRIIMSTSLVFVRIMTKIVYGLKPNLTLVRKTDDDAIFRGAAAGAGKVSLDKIHGSCPILFQPMLKSFPVAYRTRQCDMLSVPESTSFTWRLGVKTAPEKPRFIIVGFQGLKMVIKHEIHPRSIM